MNGHLKLTMSCKGATWIIQGDGMILGMDDPWDDDEWDWCWGGQGSIWRKQS